MFVVIPSSPSCSVGAKHMSRHGTASPYEASVLTRRPNTPLLFISSAGNGKVAPPSLSTTNVSIAPNKWIHERSMAASSVESCLSVVSLSWCHRAAQQGRRKSGDLCSAACRTRHAGGIESKGGAQGWSGALVEATCSAPTVIDIRGGEVEDVLWHAGCSQCTCHLLLGGTPPPRV
eukprot:3292846-Pyramimonas_sp.AAC.1